MARRIRKVLPEQKLLRIWWARLLVGAVFLAAAYGFASWAIDTGSLLLYAASLFWLWWGVKHVYRSVRMAAKR